MADVSNVYSGSDYKEALKVLQEGAIVNLLHEEESFYKMFKAKLTTGNAIAKRLEFAAKDLLGHAAVKAMAYNGAFPTRAKTSYQTIAIEPKYVGAHIEMDRTELALSKKSMASYIDLMKGEIEDKNTVMAQQLSRMIMGDGSGVIGQVASSSDLGTTGSIVLATTSSAQGSVYWFEDGDEYQILDASDSYAAHDDLGATGGSYIAVNDIDHDNNTIIVTAYTTLGVADGWQPSTALVAGDLIVRKGITYNASPTTVDVASEEMIGLEGIIDDATTSIFNISRSSVPRFKGNVRDSGGELLQVKDLHKLVKKQKIYSGKPNVGLVSFDSYERLAEIGEAMRSVISAPSLNVDLGILTVHYNSPSGGMIPIVNTRYCPTNKFYMVDTRDFEIRGNEPEFVQADNGDIFRLKPATTAYSNIETAELFGILCLFSKRPNRSGKGYNFINEEE